ncbi:GNAT family N-acetyltransferase [Pseudoalteromonas sp. MMG012]|uniref:GNAT family N-acetyltransferase n=1 Tax=Pseudoalteromonas sp. MMG012 TaxID=2822686 RepID=UPI001B39FAAE|nr:GNAT family N-acetyltransferase [Pseudoalteromonas sp. MMG012]MBQ4852321.1 GNAT family N-acetyltransferase [Pseudoalteromonas sp. MMG012]
MSELIIRTMLPHELKVAIEWARIEGWNPGLEDATLFYQADPEGFFVAELAGDIVAVGSAVRYDAHFAFCGLYIVAPEHRGKGYGLALTKHRLAYCGERNIGIDGVLENVEIYQRVGYQPYYQNKRFQKCATAHDVSSTILDVTVQHIDAVITYDKQCFPAKRDTFLKGWLQQKNGKALCVIENGQVRGYAVRRQCVEGYKVGPLFADSKAVATQLLGALQQDIIGEIIILDVPENNPLAIELAVGEHMDVVFATSRMYQHGLPDIAHHKIYGITTFELG